MNASTASAMFTFGFDVSTVNFERVGGALRIYAEEAGSLLVNNFFASGEAAQNGTFVLKDGTRVAASDFLRGFDIDVDTAAGPAKAIQNSGMFSSVEDAGDITSGIKAMGEAESISSDSGVNRLETATFASNMVSLAPLAGSGGSGFGGSSGGSSRNTEYSARAIMYKTSSGEDTVSSRIIMVDLLDKNGNPVNGDDVTWKAAAAASGSAKYFDISGSYIDPETGKLVLALSKSGRLAIEADGDGNLYSYITITVDGAKYTMQVVINRNGEFDSAVEDASASNGGKLASGGLMYGEWHSGREGGTSLDGGDIRSSDKAANLHFAGDVANTTIKTSGGDDTVTVDGALHNSVIDGGAGNDTVRVRGGMNANNGASVIRAESITVAADSSDGSANGVYARTGGNDVIAGAGGVTVDVGATKAAAGLMAYPGGVNAVSSGGNILVDVDGGKNAMGIATYHGENHVSVTRDEGHFATISVNADARDSAKAVYNHDGAIGIEAYKGNITLNATAANASGLEADGGSTTVKGCCANVSVNAHGVASAAGLLAHDGGSNSIATNRGAIDIQAVASGSAGIAKGMDAQADSNNALQSNSGDISVTARVENGANSVSAEKDGILVSARAEEYAAIGLSADGGVNSLRTEEGGMFVSAIAEEGGSIGMKAISGGRNDISVGEVGVKVDVDGTGSAIGLLASPGGVNSLDVGGSVLVDVDGVSSATGVATGYGGANTITSAKGDIHVDVGSSAGSATGVSTIHGANALTAGGSASIAIEANGVTKATGIYAHDGANTLTVKNGPISINAESTGRRSQAIGMESDGSVNGLAATGRGSITVNAVAETRGSDATALKAYDEGQNSLTVKTGDILVNAEARNNAVGMEAVNGANDLAATSRGSVTVSVDAHHNATAMAASEGGENNVSVKTGEAKITAFAEEIAAMGMVATSGGQNTVSAARGSVVVEASSDEGASTAVYANGEGVKNTVSGGSVNIIATTGSEEWGQLAGLNATEKGVNEIIATGATGLSVWAEGLMDATGLAATDGGVNTLTSSNGDISVDAVSGIDWATGLSADSGRNELTAKNLAGITVTARSDAGSVGLLANGADGGNYLSAKDGEIAIDAIAADGRAWGLDATEGENVLTATGAGGITVTADAGGGNASGMWAGDNGANRLTTNDGDIAVVSGSSSASAWGVESEFGTNDLAATRYGNVGIIATGEKDASGVHTGEGAQNTLSVNHGDLAITATAATGAGWGMSSEYGGEAVLRAMGSGDISVTVDAVTEATAMWSGTGGTNTVSAASGDILMSASASEGMAYTLESYGGENTVSAGAKGNITLKADGQGTAMGLMAADDGVNHVNATGGNILVDAASTGSVWAVGSFGGQNELGAEANGTVTIKAAGTTDAVIAGAMGEKASNVFTTVNGGIIMEAATSSKGSLKGLLANDGSNTLTATGIGTIGVNMQGMNAVLAMEAANGGANSLQTKSGGIEVSASGRYARAMVAAAVAKEGGENILTSDSGLMDLQASGVGVGARALGLSASDGGSNSLTTDKGDIAVTVSGSGARSSAVGILSDGGSNSLNAAKGDISVAASSTGARGSAYGLHAANGGIATLTGANVSVNSDSYSSAAKAFGMYAIGGGENLINASGAVSISITARPGSLKNCWGMFAEEGGSNVIIGSSTRNTVNEIEITGGMFAGKIGLNSITTGRGNDVVSISGSLVAANSDDAASVGKNIISTGRGNDTVNIVGTVGTQGEGAYSGQNLVDTGSGNDVIRIAVTGAIGVGSLTIHAGAGYDILTLVADSSEAFRDLYQDWLADLFANVDHGLEAIHVEGMTADDAPWLADLCKDYGLDLTGDTPLETAVSSVETEALNLLGDETDDALDGILLDEQSLAHLAVADISETPTEDTLSAFMSAEALPEGLLQPEDFIPAVISEGMLVAEDPESLDELLAQVTPPENAMTVGTDDAAQSDTGTAVMALVDVPLQNTDSSQEDMAILIQSAFIV